MAVRYGRVQWGKGKPRVRTAPENWRKPRIWNRAASFDNVPRPRVFCASLSDWLDHEAEHQWRVDLLNLIDDTPNLDWLLLTKRPESWSARIHECAYAAPLAARWINGEAPENVWMGTSVEDQARADERIPVLLEIPARIRFLSVEPMLGPVALPSLGFTGPNTIVDWVICGGESGPGARIMREAWALSLRDQCRAAGVAFHFKQWGGRDKKAAGRVLDGQTYDELPTPRVLQYS